MAPWQCGWENEDKLSALDKYMFAQSDIISFHCYENKKAMEKHLLDISRYNRSMLCKEYMARPLKSTFKNILPLLKKYNVGAYNWGFVAGKSKTNIACNSWHSQYEKEPELLFLMCCGPMENPIAKKKQHTLCGLIKSKPVSTEWH